ncbi:MAG: hypothetical protein WC889_07840 [Myxococcota bacterium]|jgi:hypothetical protein
MKKRVVLMSGACFAAFVCGQAVAGESAVKEERYVCHKGPGGELVCRPEAPVKMVVETPRTAAPKKEVADLYLRDLLDFKLKPGSGWILGGIPQIVQGVPTLIAGIGLLATPCSGWGCMANAYVLYFMAIPGAVLTASGGAFVGYGVSQNSKYADGRIDYASPSAGYIATGAVNTAVGVGLIIPFAMYAPKENLGIGMMALGAANVAYGLGFLIYGASTDFAKEALQKTALQKAASSLSPYFSCTGGSCDGYTNRTTGREAYVGGLRGEF